MNNLSIQGSQNLSHSHNGRTYTVEETYESANTGGGGSWGGYFHLEGGDPDWNGANSGFSFSHSDEMSAATGGSSYWRVGFMHLNLPDHSHNYNHCHYLWSDGGSESRPNNLTYKIWKRIN